MPTQISAEHQKLIDAAIRSGAYKTADQVIGIALKRLADEDEFLRARRDFIREKIETGIAQLDRGEGIPGEEVRRRMQERKAAYLAQKSRTE
jgi:antitoxin ParD1/3/4